MTTLWDYAILSIVPKGTGREDNKMDRKQYVIDALTKILKNMYDDDFVAQIEALDDRLEFLDNDGIGRCKGIYMIEDYYGEDRVSDFLRKLVTFNFDHEFFRIDMEGNIITLADISAVADWYRDNLYIEDVAEWMVDYYDSYKIYENEIDYILDFYENEYEYEDDEDFKADVDKYTPKEGEENEKNN